MNITSSYIEASLMLSGNCLAILHWLHISVFITASMARQGDQLQLKLYLPATRAFARNTCTVSACILEPGTIRAGTLLLASGTAHRA